jgi:DNA-binding NtrC family response regulator
MEEKQTTSVSQIRLLLVDDEAGFINVLAKRIEKRNFLVRKAYSGYEAVMLLNQEKFDVAVLDLKMEDMDGIELLKILKKTSPDLQVIMLTGHGSEIAAKDGIKFGAADYLIKPCDFEELIEKIRQAVSLRR